MKNPDPSTFILLIATDKDDKEVEMLVHKDRIVYIIDRDVYLKGETAHIIRNLRMGDIDLKDFRIPETKGYLGMH